MKVQELKPYVGQHAEFTHGHRTRILCYVEDAEESLGEGGLIVGKIGSETVYVNDIESARFIPESLANDLVFHGTYTDMHTVDHYLLHPEVRERHRKEVYRRNEGTIRRALEELSADWIVVVGDRMVQHGSYDHPLDRDELRALGHHFGERPPFIFSDRPDQLTEELVREPMYPFPWFNGKYA